MRQLLKAAIAFIILCGIAAPSWPGLVDAWDWATDPATGKPRRKIRLKYSFGDAKLGDKSLKDIMDEAKNNWNAAKADTGWEFEVVGAGDTADVEIKVDDGLNRAGGAETTVTHNQKTHVATGATVTFDPSPPGYEWDKAGGDKDKTKNPVSCAKHELSHLMRLDHQGGTRSKSRKLKDPQGKDTKDDDVTTVSQDDKDEAKKSSTLAIKKDVGVVTPRGDALALHVPAFAAETPLYPVTPEHQMSLSAWSIVNPMMVSLMRTDIQTMPSPFVDALGIGRMVKGVQINAVGVGGPPQFVEGHCFQLLMPFEDGAEGEGHLMDVGDPDYGPVRERSLRPFVWNPATSSWIAVDLGALGGSATIDTVGDVAQLSVPAALISMFPLAGSPDECQLLLALGSIDKPIGDALMVDPAVLVGGNPTQGRAELAVPAGPGGLNITVVSDDPAIPDPGIVSIPEGQTAKDFPVSTVGVLLPLTVNLTGTGTGFSATTQVRLMPRVVLAVDGASGAVGQSIGLGAALTRSADGAGIGGQTLVFVVDGEYAGTAITDGLGRATLPHTIPERAGAGGRYIMVYYLGDAARYPSVYNWGVLTVAAADTSTYTVDRTGVATRLVTLKAWLRRLTDMAYLAGRPESFSVDGVAVGSSLTDGGGQAQLPWIIDRPAGNYPIVARFGGDAGHNPSQGTARLTVQQLSTTIYMPDRAGEIGDYVQLKAYLWAGSTNVDGKEIIFGVEGSEVGRATTNAFARALLPYPIPPAAGAGTRNLSAQWVGDAGYLPATTTAILTVTKRPVYIFVYARSAYKPNPATLRAYVRRLWDYEPLVGAPISFMLDGSPVGTVNVQADGWALMTVNTAPLSIGLHPFTASFAGDAWHRSNYGDGFVNILAAP